MSRTAHVPLMFGVGVLAAALWPADLHAQRRAVRGPVVVRPAVVVSAQYYRPYYYAPFFWQRHPYPYPYAYGFYDPRSSLRIQGTPREAEVYVNGYYVGVVDDFDGIAQRLYLEPGEHEIAVYLDGHRVRREMMLFRPGVSYRASFALEPLGPGEQAEPRPAPPAARTPAVREPRPGAGGWRDDRGQWAPAALGTLSIRVQPADAVVFIDGERWDWPAGESRLVVDVPEGTHRVQVQRDGHEPYATTVGVRRGQVTTLNISLPRL